MAEDPKPPDYPPEKNVLERFRHGITAHFNENELRTLCFDLGIDYESLGPGGKESKVRGLIEYCVRRDRIPSLLKYCNRVRPNIGWPDLTQLQIALAELTTPDTHDYQKPVNKDSKEQVAQKRSGDSFRVQIDGVGPRAQVAVGKNITQSQSEYSEPLPDLFNELQIAIETESNPQDRSTSEENLAELQSEIYGDEPNLDRLETLKAYFIEKGGQIAASTEKLFKSEFVREVLKAAADIAVAAALKRVTGSD